MPRLPPPKAGNSRESACEGKQPFASAKLVREVIRRMNRHGRRGAHSYRCRYCAAFHVGVNLAGKRKAFLPRKGEGA